MLRATSYTWRSKAGRRSRSRWTKERSMGTPLSLAVALRQPGSRGGASPWRRTAALSTITHGPDMRTLRISHPAFFGIYSSATIRFYTEILGVRIVLRQPNLDDGSLEHVFF